MSGEVDGSAPLHGEPVLVFTASTQEELEVVHATLWGAGIHAYLNQAGPDAVVGAIDPSVGTAWVRGLYVSKADAEAALALIQTTPLSEDELAAEASADTTTLAEAEKRANQQ